MSKEFNIFVSQPMRGKSDDEIFRTMFDTFVKIKTKFDGLATPRLIDQTHVATSEKGKTRLYFLGRSIQDLAKADLVIFTDGWDRAPGCRIENEVCCRYGIPMMIDDVIGTYDINCDKTTEFTVEDFVKALESITDNRKKRGTM